MHETKAKEIVSIGEDVLSEIQKAEEYLKNEFKNAFLELLKDCDFENPTENDQSTFSLMPKESEQSNARIDFDGNGGGAKLRRLLGLSSAENYFASSDDGIWNGDAKLKEMLGGNLDSGVIDFECESLKIAIKDGEEKIYAIITLYYEHFKKKLGEMFSRIRNMHKAMKIKTNLEAQIADLNKKTMKAAQTVSSGNLTRESRENLGNLLGKYSSELRGY